MPGDYPAVLTVKQAAEFLGISEKTAYAYTANGTIPCRKVGRRTLVGRDALIKWFEADQKKIVRYPFGESVDKRRIKRW